jgi:group I intron endonuclease
VEGDSGIYQIRRLLSNKRYIGSSASISKRRWKEHKRQLKAGNHHNKYLQRAWIKYGAINFLFEILEICEPQFLLKREQWYLDNHNPEYNFTSNAQAPMKGLKHSFSTKQKMSKAQTGSGNGMFEKQHSQESRNKMSRAKAGKGKGADNPFYGHKHSVETKAMLSEINKNKTISINIKKKISATLKGRAKSATSVRKRWKPVKGICLITGLEKSI